MGLAKSHLISYPRSRNHAIRTILEYSSKRPTLGCPGTGKSDQPIYMRPANQEDIIQIESAVPVAYKSHFPHQVLHWEKNVVDDMRILFITRDPMKSIFSNVYRHFGRKLLYSTHQVEKLVQKEIDNYLGLIYMFCALNNRPRLHVKFENIFSEDPAVSLETINNMVEFVDPSAPQLTLRDLKIVFNLSKESQQSLSSLKKHRLELLIKKAIESHVNYKECLTYI